MIPFTWKDQNRQITQQKVDYHGAKAGVTTTGHKTPFWDNKKVPDIDYNYDYTTECTTL